MIRRVGQRGHFSGSDGAIGAARWSEFGRPPQSEPSSRFVSIVVLQTCGGGIDGMSDEGARPNHRRPGRSGKLILGSQRL